MDIKTDRRRVAANVAAAISSTNAPLGTVAEAADMREIDLEARLNGAADFTVNDLVRVGGFLRVPTARFFEGVTP